MSPTTSIKAPELKNPVASFTGQGLTSRQSVTVNLYKAEKGKGINFLLPGYKDGDDTAVVKAVAENVVSTTRNTALGIGKQRVCFVEHILCAFALCQIEDMYIEVQGYELPMGNGSADFWITLLEENGLASKTPPKPTHTISQPVAVTRGTSSVIAYPANIFQATYLMDLNHPQIGRVWKSWSADQDIRTISDARTFGSLLEHVALGFEKNVVSYTKDGFTMPLNSPDEPVRHKMLDLIGDLILTGVNPLHLGASVVSIKGGHAIDVEMANELVKYITKI